MSSGTEERSTARKQRHRDHFPPVGCVYATYVNTSASNSLSSAEACVKSEGVCMRFLPPWTHACLFGRPCDASCEVQPVTASWLRSSAPRSRSRRHEHVRRGAREAGWDAAHRISKFTLGRVCTSTRVAVVKVPRFKSHHDGELPSEISQFGCRQEKHGFNLLMHFRQ